MLQDVFFVSGRVVSGTLTANFLKDLMRSKLLSSVLLIVRNGGEQRSKWKELFLAIQWVMEKNWLVPAVSPPQYYWC